MTRPRTSLATTALAAGVAAVTTWVALLSWRGFTEDSVAFLRPLVVVALVIAAVGAVGRWQRLPGVAVVALQALSAAAATCWSLVGTPLPTGAAWARLVDAFGQAVTSANRYAPPVPDHVPGVEPLLVAGGAACLLLVDLLACTARRVPLAGLPLLVVYSVPVSIIGGGLSWWVFALTAAGFMTLLFLHENEQVARWGRPLGEDRRLGDSESFSVRTGASRTSAGAIGGVATALAIVVPLAVPTLDLHLFDVGPGAGDREIELSNPMVDLRRDLLRDEDLPLVVVRTSDPAPSYLRISVLNRFAENEWSSGDRAIPTTQLADGEMPSLEGVDTEVPRKEFDYEVSVTDAFDSRWLPTQAPVTSVTAQGDWRFDRATMDFIAGDNDMSAAGLTYDMTAVQLAPDPREMLRAPSSVGMVSRDFVELPDRMPPIVRELATSVTENVATPFEKAVALQDWFREKGGFEYSLDVDPGSGNDELVEFLSDEPGGRTGYCEQFAAAMAVMARTLNIPARVAVGFLRPQRVGAETYEYSSFDLHAWPELFIPGSGWVRFEPTPPDRANGVPAYTQVDVNAEVPDLVPTESAQPSNAEDVVRGDTANPGSEKQDRADGSADESGSGFPWWVVGGTAAAVLVLGALLALPRSLRRSRRRTRLAGGPEDIWLELRDTMVDLGLPWPADRSPRQTRDRLVQHFGAPSDATVERPAQGPELAPQAVAGLDRLVAALEQQRYARAGGIASSALGRDGEACVTSLEDGATPRARRRAEWWPRSLFRRDGGRRGSLPPGGSVTDTRHATSGVLDRV